MSALGGGGGATTCQPVHIPVLSAFLSFCRWLRRSFFPPFSDDQDDLTYDEIGFSELNANWDLREIEHQYSVQHCERCLAKGTVEPPRT